MVVFFHTLFFLFVVFPQKKKKFQTDFNKVWMGRFVSGSVFYLFFFFSFNFCVQQFFILINFACSVFKFGRCQSSWNVLSIIHLDYYIIKYQNSNVQEKLKLSKNRMNLQLHHKIQIRPFPQHKTVHNRDPNK